MVESIKMPLGMWTRGLSNQPRVRLVLDPNGKGRFRGGNNVTCPDLPGSRFSQSDSQGAAHGDTCCSPPLLKQLVMTSGYWVTNLTGNSGKPGKSQGILYCSENGHCLCDK